MRVVGTDGARTILTHMGKFEQGMTRDVCRDILYGWSEVNNQLTIMERLFRDNGIILLYQSKASPMLNMTEVLVGL